MKKIFIFLIIGLVIIIVLNSGKNKETVNKNSQQAKTSTKNNPTQGTKKNLGSYFGPRNFPYSMFEQDMEKYNEFFRDTKEIGNHVSFLVEWKDMGGKYLKQGVELSKKNGLKVYLHFDPLTGGTREAPAPPETVSGKSFADEDVKTDFKNKVLELAALKPEVLGIGTEVNLLLYKNNQKEFDLYVKLSEETYKLVKEKYPKQTVTLSFSWDIMYKQQNFEILQKFKNSTDIFSFTTYPNVLTAPTPELLPSNFYNNIRKYLPTEKIAISEISWYSGEKGSEDLQTEFFTKLPSMLSQVKPEFVTLFFLYDLPDKFVNDEKFNTSGIIKLNGTKKKAWNAVKSLTF